MAVPWPFPPTPRVSPLPSLPQGAGAAPPSRYPDYNHRTHPAARGASVIQTQLIYCGDNLQKLRDLPGACVDLIYIDPPFNSNRNYEVFWGDT